MKKKESSGHEHPELLWTKEKAFLNKTSDFFIESNSKQPFQIMNTKAEEIIEDQSAIPVPSLLSKAKINHEKVEAADLFIPTNLVVSNKENKIYGFYYLHG